MHYPEIQKKKSVNETFYTSKLSLDPLKLSKNVNKAGIKISKHHLLLVKLFVKLLVDLLVKLN